MIPLIGGVFGGLLIVIIAFGCIIKNRNSRNKMKKLLERLFTHDELNREEAKSLMFEIADDKYNELQLASLLTIFRMRPISMEEFAGFRETKSAVLKIGNYGNVTGYVVPLEKHQMLKAKTRI